MPAVSEPLEFSTQAQTAPERRCNSRDCEDIVRTDRDAFFLAFTTIPIDDRPDHTRRLFAVCVLDIHQAVPSNDSAESVEQGRHFRVVYLGKFRSTYRLKRMIEFATDERILDAVKVCIDTAFGE